MAFDLPMPILADANFIFSTYSPKTSLIFILKNGLILIMENLNNL